MPPYRPGQSGNPAGRPKGVRDKRVALRALLEPHVEALVAKVVAKALEGDTAALRLCLERIIPPLKSRDENIVIEGLEEGLANQAREVVRHMASGHITPNQAYGVLRLIAGQARIIEVAELERRVEQLEDKHDS